MKTLKGWTKANINFDKYVTEPCEVDKNIIEDMSYYVGMIRDTKNNIEQINEAEDKDENGNLRYATFAERDNRFYYLGSFVSCDENNLEHILEIIDKIKG